MSQDEIFEKVKAILVDALSVDDDQVTPQSRLQADLDAESIDFLDIVFRLEREFGIKIDRNELFPESIFQGDPDFVQDGKVTPKGLAELKEKMPFADIGSFEQNPEFEQIGDLFTVNLITQYVGSKVNGYRSLLGVRARVGGRGSRLGAWSRTAPRTPAALPEGREGFYALDLDRPVHRVRVGQVRDGREGPLARRGPLRRALPGLPGDAGHADPRRAGPDRRHPRRRGQPVPRKGGPRQDPQGQVPPGRDGRRDADLRCRHHRSPAARGVGRRQGDDRRRGDRGGRDLLRPP